MSAQNTTNNHVFLIGPGGSGKTTAGRLAATHLGWNFIDLDEQFISSSGDITTYIKTEGYEAYIARNAQLCRDLVGSHNALSFLMALSSGFLATDVLPDLVAANRTYIESRGKTLLLLPSLAEKEAEEIIISRQLSRGFNLDELKERAKFRERFYEYQKIKADLILSSDTTSITAKNIAEAALR